MDKETIDFFVNFNPQKQPKDKNIFDTGIHNMYENPFTEILKFIMDSHSPYNNRIKFIKYFIFELTKDENISDSFSKEINIETQITTEEKKFIDMIIYNDEYVITLENKIEHIPINPFKEYESYINMRYPSQKKFYYLFSFYECENDAEWNNILFGDVFSVIKNKLQFKDNNKWDYFVEDFLDHYIKERVQMTKKDFELCERNFSKFIEGKDYLKQFIDTIINKLKLILNPKNIKQQDKADYNHIELRLRPFENDGPDIVLYLNYNNSFSINIYYDDRSCKNISELLSIVGDKYSPWTEGRFKCFELKENNYFRNIKDAYKEIEIQWNKMKEIYKGIYK